MTAIPFLVPGAGSSSQSSPLATGGEKSDANGAFAGFLSLEGKANGTLGETPVLESSPASAASNFLSLIGKKALAALVDPAALPAQDGATDVVPSDAADAPEDGLELSVSATIIATPVIASSSPTATVDGQAPVEGAAVAPAGGPQTQQQLVAPQAQQANTAPQTIAGLSAGAAAGADSADGPAQLQQFANDLAAALNEGGGTDASDGADAAIAASRNTGKAETAQGDAQKLAGVQPQPAAAIAKAEKPAQAQTASSVNDEDTDELQPASRNTGDKPGADVKPAATGLERGLERAVTQAQARIELNMARHAQFMAPAAPEHADAAATTDAPDLGATQGAIDATRTIRLSALTGQSNQLQLPVAQIAVQIAAHARAGANRFSIRLDPPELGKIDIRLEVSQDGSVASRLSVERPETLDMLLRDSKALERALNDAGFKTDEGALRFSLKGEGFSRQQRDGHDQQGHSQARQRAAINAINDGATLANAQRYLASSGLDITV